jgi:hypothetical protein
VSASRLLLLAALIISVALALSLRGVDRLWIVIGIVVAWIAASAFEWVSWKRAEARWSDTSIDDVDAYPSFMPPPRPQADSDLAATIFEASAATPDPEPAEPRRRLASFRIGRSGAPDVLEGNGHSAGLDEGAEAPRDDRAEVARFLRDTGVHGQKKPDVVRSVFKPHPDRHGHAESWLEGALYLHLEAWIRPGLPNVDACKLSFDLQRQFGRLEDRPGDRAIGYVEDFVDGGRRRKKREWVDRPVLVLVREIGKSGEDVEGDEPLSVDVRLTGPYGREVVAADAWKPGMPPPRGLESAYELGPVAADREGDRALLSPAEIAVGGGRSTALRERPGQVVEAASQVVDDVAEPKAKPVRKRRKRRYGEDEAVTVRVVFDRRGGQRLGIIVDCEGLELSLEYLYLCYCPGPLEPRAVE